MARAKQQQLPGTEDHRLEDLHSAAEAYVDVRDERMALTEKEVERRDEVRTLMLKHKKKVYHCDGVEIKIIDGEPKIKVKVRKENEES